MASRISTEPAKQKVYVSAFVCNDIIRDRETDLLTAIKIANGFNAPISTFVPRNPDGTPDSEGRIIISSPIICHLVISFFCEVARSVSLTVKAKLPTGDDMANAPNASQTFDIGAGAAGRVPNVELSMASDTEGTHWIEVYVHDEIATKVPLKIERQIQPEIHRIPQTPTGASL
jgi:hypothetical protein